MNRCPCEHPPALVECPVGLDDAGDDDEGHADDDDVHAVPVRVPGVRGDICRHPVRPKPKCLQSAE